MLAIDLVLALALALVLALVRWRWWWLGAVFAMVVRVLGLVAVASASWLPLLLSKVLFVLAC